MSQYVLLALLAVCLDGCLPEPASAVADPRAAARAGHLAAAAGGVLLGAVATTWGLERALLADAGLGYLRLLVFLLVTAVLARIAARLRQRSAAPSSAADETMAQRVAVVALVLGTAPLALPSGAGLGTTLALSAGLALGFAALRVLAVPVRVRLALADVPAPLRGTPIALLTAGLVALALLGFDGLLAG